MPLLVKEWNVIKNLDSCKAYLIVIPVRLSWNKRLIFSRVNRATGSFTSLLMRKGFRCDSDRKMFTQQSSTYLLLLCLSRAVEVQITCRTVQLSHVNLTVFLICFQYRSSHHAGCTVTSRYLFQI